MVKKTVKDLEREICQLKHQLVEFITKYDTLEKKYETMEKKLEECVLKKNLLKCKKCE